MGTHLVLEKRDILQETHFFLDNYKGEGISALRECMLLAEQMHIIS